MRTIDEITLELLVDNRPGVDGFSNADRVSYVCAVMKCGPIELDTMYDFSPVLACQEEEVVEASKQVATLQLDYMRRLYEHRYLEKTDYEIITASLILDIQRLGWHLRHVAEGKITPPFPFIN